MHLSTSKMLKKSSEVRKSKDLFNSAFSKTLGKLFGNAGLGILGGGGFGGEVDICFKFFFIGLLILSVAFSMTSFSHSWICYNH